MTDEELIQQCLSGQPKAQKELFDRFAPKMMGVCVRYAPNYDEAQDVLQDGFVKVFQNLNKFQSKGSFEGWIRRTMVNTALDHLRKNKQARNQVDIEGLEIKSDRQTSVLEDMAANDLLQLIHQLPTGYRTVFNMFAIEGYSHKEIADELDITESTSKSQYRKAKAYLRNLVPSRTPIQS